ncbi:MAG: tetratricopeptide repeat protein [Planctomycetota bacterium]|jgi:tetratricopeptide (TPR) repeat protein
MKSLRAAAVLCAALCAALALSPAGAGEISMAEAQRRLKNEADDANALFSLSFYFEGAGRPFSALRAVERAIEMDGKVPGYHARYGQLLMGRRRIRESAAAYAKAADMDPKTKSFRAAAARALTACDMLREAAASWKTLLDGTDVPREILDAARQLEAVHRRMNDLAGAEDAWRTAHGKLKERDQRMTAAGSASAVMVARGAPERAVKFWEQILAAEKSWEHRADTAGRLFSAARTPSTKSVEMLSAADKAWKGLLDAAATDTQRQRSASAQAEVHLAAGQAPKAVAVLRPWLFARDWNHNFNAANVLHRAYTATGDAEARRKMWLEFVKRSRNYSERSAAVSRLATITEEAAELVELRRQVVSDYPKEISGSCCPWSGRRGTIAWATSTATGGRW